MTMTLMISDSLTQPLPHPHFVALPVPALQTPQEVRDHLTHIYNALSQPRQVEFQDVARQHPGWASDMAKAHPFMVAIHEKFQPMQEVEAPQVPHNPWDAAPIPTPAPQPAPVPAAIAPVPPVQVAPVQATPVAPVPVTPVIPATPEVQALEEDVEADEPEVPEDTEPVEDSEETEGVSEPEEEATQEVEPLPLEVAANPHGLFSQLYAMCGQGGSVGLSVHRVGNNLLRVIVTPSGIKGEQGKDIRQGDITTTPEALDAEFAFALAEYVAERQEQMQKALSVSEQLKQSMQKKAPAKAKSASPAKYASKPVNQAKLQITANVTAKLIVKAENGKPETHDVGPEHRDLPLKPGKYKLTVQADGYLAQSQEVTLEAAQTLPLQFALTNAGLGF